MNPFAIVGAVAAAGYGVYKAATATKEVPPAVEAALAQQAVPIAIQQINAGVPPGIAAQIAAKVVVDAVLVPAGTPTTPYVDPDPPHVEGDPKAGGYYVRWILEHGIGSPRAGLKEVYVHYFATAAERNAFFDSPLNRMGSGTYMPTNFSKGGPDVKSADLVMATGGIVLRPSSQSIFESLPKIEGDPKAGVWMVSWIVTDMNGPTQSWRRFFATQAEQQSFVKEIPAKPRIAEQSAKVTGVYSPLETLQILTLPTK